MQKIQKHTIGIIGGGVSGLSAAYFLNKINPEIDVTVFQSTAKVGGRANSFVKQINEETKFTFDHGASYFTEDTPEQEQFLQKNLFKNPEFLENLVKIERPIYTLDQNNIIQKSDRKQTNKYTYSNGIRNLSEILKNNSTSNFELDKKVINVSQNLNDNKWQVICEKTENSYIFDEILFAIHPFSLLKILKNNQSQNNKNPYFESLIKELENVKYRSIANISLGYEIPEQYKNKYPFQDFYALLNVDRSNDVSWVNFESDKIGHLDNQKYLGIGVQMSKEWTLKNWESSYDECVSKIKQKLIQIFEKNENSQHLQNNSALLDTIKQEKHIFQLVRKWEYALHDTKVDENLELFKQLKQQGAYFCGDYFYEKARVTNAMISGFQIANTIQSQKITQKI